MYAFVDSHGEVAETDETNNISGSGDACQSAVPPDSFTPVLEWSWKASGSIAPDRIQVAMTPIVANLTDDNLDGLINDDDRPDILFTVVAADAHDGGGLPDRDGVIVALHGDDGSEIFVSEPGRDNEYDLAPFAQLAVGDIDGDGLPEIVGASDRPGHIVGFNHDGTPMFFSDTVEEIDWGGPSLADFNGDGASEIVVGRQILDSTGTLLYGGSDDKGFNGGVGPLSVIADVDGDGELEIVAGPSAYDVDVDPAGSSMALLWDTAGVVDGFAGVADFDSDDEAEVVVVGNGSVWLLNGSDGAVIWGPKTLPAASGGGPPAIADFDGDGSPEVAVAGNTALTVFETDGTTLWDMTVQDVGSSRTSSAAFDFDGDGAAEVVYRDEQHLWVFNGDDGAVLLEIDFTSGTALENPVVADVDKDGNAEIVVGASNYLLSSGGHTGLRVYGDANDSWVNTRRIWNQHPYHITNIDDDGSIPTAQQDNWTSYNNFRTQEAASSAEIFAAPDLTASYLRYMVSPLVMLTARVGNRGAVDVSDGVPVSFYENHPKDGLVLLGTVHTQQRLGPGQFEDVALSIGAAFGSETMVVVVVDDLGTGKGVQNECSDANNPHSWSFGPCDFDSHLVLETLEIDSTETFQACSTIIVGPALDVMAGGVVTLRSGEEVTFNDGVAVLPGGALTVEIDSSLAVP